MTTKLAERNYDAIRLALAELRTQQGMTLYVLSGLAGVPRSVLTDVEAGWGSGGSVA